MQQHSTALNDHLTDTYIYHTNITDYMLKIKIIYWANSEKAQLTWAVSLSINNLKFPKNINFIHKKMPSI